MSDTTFKTYYENLIRQQQQKIELMHRTSQIDSFRSIDITQKRSSRMKNLNNNHIEQQQEQAQFYAPNEHQNRKISDGSLSIYSSANYDNSDFDTFDKEQLQPKALRKRSSVLDPEIDLQKKRSVLSSSSARKRKSTPIKPYEYTYFNK